MGMYFFSPMTLKGIRAAEPDIVFEDDFSSGSFEKWLPVRDDGQYWQVVDGVLEVTVPKRNTITEIIPKDDYWSSDWKNIEFSYELTPLKGVDRNTSFGWESIQTWFEVHFLRYFLNLVRVGDSTVSLNVFEDFEMVNGQTYHVTIRIVDTTISLFVDGDLITEKNLPSFVNNGGKIGLKAGTGSIFPTQLRYDNISVKLVDTNEKQSLAVPEFKQTDPQWADDIYDSAQNWSDQPTMSRWGCLTSSMAMVLNYHGIETFPDGTPITPASLNQWLKSQPDGYLGEGYLNWVAMTRLTHQISQAFQTPKLEYIRSAGHDIQTSITEIHDKKPTILEIPGHFLVATGFTADKNDLRINDPGYSFEYLSQHNADLVSTRLLTPSYTDLSYLLTTGNANLTMELQKHDGSPVENWQQFSEQLTADSETNQETQPATSIGQLAQPLHETYRLLISQKRLEPFSLKIISYDREAQPTIFEMKGWVGPEPLAFTIAFDEQGQATIRQDLSFTLIREQLAWMKNQGVIPKPQFFNQLDRFAEVGEEAEIKHDTKKQLKQVKQLMATTQAFSHNWILKSGYELLTFLLTELQAQIENVN